MDPASRMLVATYLAHVVLGAVQASILAHFYRLSRQDYLRWWTYSFVGVCVYHASAAAAVFWVTTGAGDQVTRLIASWLSQVAVYVQVTLLLVGSLQIAGVRPLTRRSVTRLVWLAALLGTGVSLAYAFVENGASERLWLRVGLRYLICSIAFMTTAVLLWRLRSRHAGRGIAMVALAFSSYGLLLSFEFGLFVLQWAQQRRIDGAELISVFDLVAQACIAFGVIIWVAEDAHGRADRATRDFEHAKRFDVSTGLPNRAEMERRIQGELERTDIRHVGVFAIDLVNLVDVSRAFGIDQAEAIARTASQRLLEPGAISGVRIGRLDTHRFVASVASSDTATAWDRLALEWIARLERPYASDATTTFAIECSIGIAIGPGDGTDAKTLLAHAELATHGSRQSMAFYSIQRDGELRQRLAFAEESLAGLRAGQIVPYFQPIVKADGAIAGFEVLARWAHPARGLLPPADFLHVLADRGAMAELDRHMLTQACRHASAFAVPRISLNVSPEGFERDGLVGEVRDALAASALPPQCLCLEITESTALIDLARTRAILLELRELGVTIALDDFGTGYSSLAHLRELPIDSIKIDRVFAQAALHDARTAAIVESLVTLAQRLELQIVIEGIEAQRELDYFRRLGATRFQGWLFAPAYRFDEARTLSHVAARRSAGLDDRPSIDETLTKR